MGLRQKLLLDFERFVGVRYLHRARAGRGSTLALAVTVAVSAAGLGAFLAGRGGNRALETAGVVVLLLGTLGLTVLALLRFFSVFTTVSTMGVVLGVASLVVVLEVTSGFEHEFRDKVLGLNAHLIVIPYGDVDVDSPEADAIRRKLAGVPGVVRMAKFAFSAGEVMVGKVGANLKAIDLVEGADELRRSLVGGRVEDLGRPATCAGPALPAFAGGGTATTETAGRIVLGAELAHRLHKKVGDCVTVMVPFTSAAEPPHSSFKVVGVFRMGFNEYDTRLAYVSLADARLLGGSRGSVVGVELRFADPMEAFAAVSVVQARLGPGYRVIDWKTLNGNLFTALAMQKLIIALLLVLIVVVAAFNILASLTMIVLSKVREIAILKSMGARSGAVARIFLVAGSTVGAVGAGLGVGYGLFIAKLAALYGYPLDPKVYLIGSLPVRFEPFWIGVVAFGTLGVCLLATLYPSWRASRLRAVDGLRYD